MRRLLPLCVVLLAMPAHAGMFDDSEARSRIDRLKGDLDDVVQRVDTATKNQLEFANQVEEIKADIARLRGQLEVIANDLDTTQKRQQDFYVDLDNRLRKFESAAAPEQAAAAKAADPAAETQDYEAALTALKSSKFAGAAAGFTAFIDAYPDSAMQPSAHFWAGYCYSQLKEPGKAAALYGKLAATWPKDAKAPDALLEQAGALEATGKRSEAHKVLESLVANYPSSEAAKKAKWRLSKKQ